MTRTPADEPLRLTDRDDLLEAVPHLLGFRPEASLVLLGLRATGRPGRHAVGLTQRLDLPPPPAEREAARLLVRNAVRDGATAAWASLHLPVVPQGPPLPRRRLATELLRACDEAGLELVEALAVAGDRSWSYLCHEPGCCPPEGRPVRDPLAGSAIGAALVAQGSAPLPRRADLVASVAAVPAPDVTAAVGALEALLARCDEAAVLVETLQVARSATVAAGQGRLPDAVTAGRLVVGVQAAAARQAVVLGTDRELWPGGVLLWSDVVRRCPADLVAEPAVVLAWLAYRSGSGALTRTALERALEADTDHAFARLLEALLDAAVPPAELEAAAARAGRPRRVG